MPEEASPQKQNEDKPLGNYRFGKRRYVSGRLNKM